jgi:hypothetical protein
LQELDSKDEEHAAWWDSLVIVCDQELSMASRQQDADRARLRGYDQPEVRRLREVGVHSAVDAQISELLSGTPPPPPCMVLYVWVSCREAVRFRYGS